MIPTFVNRVKKNQFINIYGNGNQVRSFCYVSDAADALTELILTKKKNKIYNIGNNQEPIKIIDLARLICKLANKKK